MDRLPPIPSPPGHLVREFFHRAVPVLAFVGAAVTLGLTWNKRFTGTMLFGEVEPVRADVVTLAPGAISDLLVERFQLVTNGQVLATIESFDTEAAQRDLDVLRAELNVLRSRTSLDEVRNEQNTEDLRMRWLEARVNLATAKVTLENATRDLRRAQELFEAKVIPEAEFDAAKSFHDALDTEVRERTTLVQGLESTLAKLDASNQKDRGGATDAFGKALAAQERALEQSRTHVLRAPMDGMVKVVNHRRGERVVAGAAIATVTSHSSEHIVGFVRQPLTIDPRPGMQVEIRTRGPKRQVATSSIRSVGSELELVGAPLRLRGFDNSVERGLAFFIDLPPGLDVHPGELVDLIVRPHP